MEVARGICTAGYRFARDKPNTRISMKRQMRREQHQVAPPVNVVPCWTEGVRDAHPFEPADGFGEDLRTAPSDATKNIGQWTADAEEAVAAVEALAHDEPRWPNHVDI